MVLMVRDAIKPYCQDIILHDSVEPDIVVSHKGKVIAFEIETGSWVEKRSKELEERFRKLKEKYKDGYYIIVTNAAYEPEYQQYASVITKPKIRESLTSILS